MNNSAISKTTWEELEKEIYTPEEIAASDLRVALINEMIKAREGQGLSQRELEKWKKRNRITMEIKNELKE